MNFEPTTHVPNSEVQNLYFYHAMDLPEIGFVPGDWDLRPCLADYTGRVDFRRKRVLDVGAATGALSFFAEQQRAESVVSFDQSESSPMNLLAAWNQSLDGIRSMKRGYWLSHRLLKSRNQVFYGNIYNLPDDLGLFDVAIVGSILLHLESPVSALRNIAKLAKSIVITEVVRPECKNGMIFRPLYNADAPANDYLVWWYFAPETIRKMLESFDYKVVSSVSLKAFSPKHGMIDLIAHVGVKLC